MSILESLSSDDRHKLEAYVETAKQELQKVDDIKDSLRDAAKALAEEFGVKAKHLLAAARTAYKNDLGQKKEDMSTMEDILTMTGHG